MTAPLCRCTSRLDNQRKQHCSFVQEGSRIALRGTECMQTHCLLPTILAGMRS